MQEILWGVGAEYTYNDRFSLRAGYHHESESQGNRKYFTFGAGFKMSIFQLMQVTLYLHPQATHSTKPYVYRWVSTWMASKIYLEEEDNKNGTYQYET